MSSLLSGFLRKNYLNFEVVQLSNGPVIIDGDDFLAFFCQKNDFSKGEYLQLVLGLSEILKNIQKCKIEPIFVVDNDLATQAYNDPYSNCVRSSFLSMLQCANLLVLTPDEPVTRAAISLAAYLQCPLLASKLQYFLPVPEHTCQVAPPKFIPVDLLETKPVFANPEVETPCLLAHAFHPDIGDLCQIRPSRYPILSAFLFDSGCLFTPDRLPSIFSGNHSKLLTEDQLRALIEWLAMHCATSKQIIDELLSNYPIEQQAGLSRKLATLFTSHLFNADTIGQNLAYRSGLTLIGSCDHNDQCAFVNSDELLIDSEYLGRILDGEAIHPAEVNITLGWPMGLATAYRQAKLIDSMMKAPYIHDYIQLGDHVADFPQCVHSVTRPLRVACYRVLVSLEESMNTRNKLVGFQPDLIEKLQCNGKVRTYRIPVSPLEFYLDCESADQIIVRLLDIPRCLDAPDPDWLVSVAITLAIWYHKDPGPEVGGKPPLERSPLVLAVAASAVANVSNVDRLDEEMCSYYGRLIDLLRLEYTNTVRRLGRDPTEGHTRIVHQFVGLQRIYDYLRLLVSLVDNLFEEEQRSVIFHFLPRWIIFPSSNLVSLLTALLELQIPLIRQDHVCHFWLPKMVRKQRSDPTQLKRATDFFTRLINLASALLQSNSAFLHPTCVEDVSSSLSILTISPTPRDSASETVQLEPINEWGRGKVIISDNKRSSWERSVRRWTESNAPRKPLAEFSNKPF